ncbi:hypothetical protein OHC33_009221 [Knufia fluminis]|uniref:Trichodiene oxygenase n=1 Tax=Knufia fluminis TaxID=191047 RepID=A0AAN8I1T1_9EURO|nr:hypothetical protein OHC33_009221 [Knufia fluminis]
MDRLSHTLIEEQDDFEMVTGTLATTSISSNGECQPSPDPGTQSVTGRDNKHSRMSNITNAAAEDREHSGNYEMDSANHVEFTKEDNTWITSRALVMVRSTSGEQASRILESMDSRVRQSLSEKMIDPMIYHFRLKACEELRVQQAINMPRTRAPNQNRGTPPPPPTATPFMNSVDDSNTNNAMDGVDDAEDDDANTNAIHDADCTDGEDEVNDDANEGDYPLATSEGTIDPTADEGAYDQEDVADEDQAEVDADAINDNEDEEEEEEEAEQSDAATDAGIDNENNHDHDHDHDNHNHICTCTIPYSLTSVSILRQNPHGDLELSSNRKITSLTIDHSTSPGNGGTKTHTIAKIEVEPLGSGLPGAKVEQATQGAEPGAVLYTQSCFDRPVQMSFMPNYSDTATNPKLLRVFIGQIARGSQHVCRQIVMAGSWVNVWSFAMIEKAISILIYLLTSLVIYNIGLTLYRLYFHPLAKFPGPRLAAITGWDEFYYDAIKGGRMIWHIQELHDEYGPIVRTGPDELHIRDSSFYDELYISGNKGRDKWDRVAGYSGPPETAVSTVGHTHHRIRRASLNPFFSRQNIRHHEPAIKDRLSRLFSRLRECQANGEVVRMDCAYMALTMDIVSSFAFGSNPSHLSRSDFNVAWHNAMVEPLKGQPYLKQFPYLQALFPLMVALPEAVLNRINPEMSNLMTWMRGMRKDISRTIEINEKGERVDGTIFQAILDSDVPASEKTLTRLEGEGSVVLAAGSETTARCLSVVTFYIMYDRAILRKLRNELGGLRPEADGFFALGQLETLPYLTACIKEGLRLTGVVGRLPRISHEPVQYKDWVIPPGTPVSMANYHTHHDPDNFPSPLEYRPERWIEASQDGLKLDKYLVAFGRGTRSCIGMNLAWTELYLTLAHVVTKFDFEVYDTTIERDIRTDRDYFVTFPREDSMGIRMKVVDAF